jgi:hypothetical protein
MPERDKSSDQSSPAKSGSPPRRDDGARDRNASQDPAEENEQSTTSRPRGHTEDPDKTL